MGLLGIGKGIAKMIKGVAEGDIAEVGKGAVKTAVGVVTTVFGIGGDNDVDNSD